MAAAVHASRGGFDRTSGWPRGGFATALDRRTGGRRGMQAPAFPRRAPAAAPLPRHAKLRSDADHVIRRPCRILRDRRRASRLWRSSRPHRPGDPTPLPHRTTPHRTAAHCRPPARAMAPPPAGPAHDALVASGFYWNGQRYMRILSAGQTANDGQTTGNTIRTHEAAAQYQASRARRPSLPPRLPESPGATATATAPTNEGAGRKRRPRRAPREEAPRDRAGGRPGRAIAATAARAAAERSPAKQGTSRRRHQAPSDAAAAALRAGRWAVRRPMARRQAGVPMDPAEAATDALGPMLAARRVWGCRGAYAAAALRAAVLLRRLAYADDDGVPGTTPAGAGAATAAPPSPLPLPLPGPWSVRVAHAGTWLPVAPRFPTSSHRVLLVPELDVALTIAWPWGRPRLPGARRGLVLTQWRLPLVHHDADAARDPGSPSPSPPPPPPLPIRQWHDDLAFPLHRDSLIHAACRREGTTIHLTLLLDVNTRVHDKLLTLRVTLAPPAATGTASTAGMAPLTSTAQYILRRTAPATPMWPRREAPVARDSPGGSRPPPVPWYDSDDPDSDSDAASASEAAAALGMSDHASGVVAYRRVGHSASAEVLLLDDRGVVADALARMPQLRLRRGAVAAAAPVRPEPRRVIARGACVGAAYLPRPQRAAAAATGGWILCFRGRRAPAWWTPDAPAATPLLSDDAWRRLLDAALLADVGDAADRGAHAVRHVVGLPEDADGSDRYFLTMHVSRGVLWDRHDLTRPVAVYPALLAASDAARPPVVDAASARVFFASGGYLHVWSLWDGAPLAILRCSPSPPDGGGSCLELAVGSDGACVLSDDRHVCFL
ncbi:hypothetical protein CXG81DRAFT_19708 [Caulochytrium protostelioides]|uniref:Uncharacterized protein n=1 Tax=Caulochytrium protostelioides TaxID=1555241 RepID=A0A4P9X5H3_9FUNG|nr:hypothetical protein CXG81DRAFT_19708 [Caulochytrium protostelioides]|eukprot:RKP00311.1 hypothetical protein CXG81DRAFT_19708 [Caulochytrium protostelioides]